MFRVQTVSVGECYWPRYATLMFMCNNKSTNWHWAPFPSSRHRVRTSLETGRRLAFVQAQKATIGRDRRLRYGGILWLLLDKYDDQYACFEHRTSMFRQRKRKPSATADRKNTCVRDPAEFTCMSSHTVRAAVARLARLVLLGRVLSRSRLRLRYC